MMYCQHRPVTVFFLDGSGDYDPVCIIQKSQILHDLCSIYSRYDAAALIRSSTPANLCLGLKTFIRVELPVVDVANAYSVDVGVVADQRLAGSHVAQHIALGIDLYLVKV